MVLVWPWPTFILFIEYFPIPKAMIHKHAHYNLHLWMKCDSYCFFRSCVSFFLTTLCDMGVRSVPGRDSQISVTISDPGLLCNTWWRHQMETFSALLAICVVKSPVPGEFPHKGQWRGALMFSLICAWINGWVNNKEAGDLRRYRAHYEVAVMISMIIIVKWLWLISLDLRR